MTFNVSPGVSFNEFDLTTTVPAVAATPAAFSGIMQWGPCLQPILLGSPNDLLTRFFQPSDLNGETWFTAYSFLTYGSQLWFNRTGDFTGNTQAQVYQNTANAFTAGNNVVLLSNTGGLAVGMKLFFSNNAGLSNNQDGGVFITAVNSSSVSLSAAPTANAGNVELIFRSNITYTGFGQTPQVLNLEWADFNILNPNTYAKLEGTFDPSLLYGSRYPGEVGNSIRVAVCETANQFTSNINLLPNADINSTATFLNANVGSNTITITITPANTASAENVASANALAGSFVETIAIGDQLQTGNTYIGFQVLKVAQGANVSETGNVFTVTLGTTNPYTLVANTTQTFVKRFWEFYNLVGTAPGQSQWQFNMGNTSAMDQLHVVVVDELGTFTGDPGAILETYKNLSRATDAINLNNTTNYYANVINQQSAYIWWLNDHEGAFSNTAAFLTSSTNLAPLDLPFAYADDGLSEDQIELASITAGFSYFLSPQDYDISLVLTGKALGLSEFGNTQLATWLINNLAQVRRDCVVFCSPDIADVVNNEGFEALDIVTARNTMPSTSYAFMDNGYVYMYDNWNNVYRWIPLNGSCAGLAAQTDHTNAPWWAFSGFNRGNVKNVVTLAWNPEESDRDLLYSNQVNPVVTFPNLGTVLYGDKTMLAEPSAFNRINVRRLFIVLEKSISTAAQFFLFEFNDSFTRAQFVSMVTPFLQYVQSLRGLEQFVVRCDTTNNTPYVIQNNQFVADIFIQPNYVIDWILLNFVNVPPTISFTEAESIQF